MAFTKVPGKQIKEGAITEVHIAESAQIKETNLAIDWEARYEEANTLLETQLSGNGVAEGASKISIHDATNVFSASTVEGALVELNTKIESVGEATGGSFVYHKASHVVTEATDTTIDLADFTGESLPAYVVGNDSLDVYLNGSLQSVDINYAEVAGGTAIDFSIGGSLNTGDVVLIKYRVSA